MLSTSVQSLVLGPKKSLSKYLLMLHTPCLPWLLSVVQSITSLWKEIKFCLREIKSENQECLYKRLCLWRSLHQWMEMLAHCVCVDILQSCGCSCRDTWMLSAYIMSNKYNWILKRALSSPYIPHSSHRKNEQHTEFTRDLERRLWAAIGKGKLKREG